MYDPKFSIKQMYDQYGSSRTSSSSTTTTAGPRGYTRKSTPAPTPQQRTDRRYVPTNIAAPKSTSRTDRTAPPRAVDYSKGLGSRAFKPETEELSTWEKVKSAFTNTMEKFGIFDEPDTTTTPDAVYKDGNLFSPEPYMPDTSRYEGDPQLKDMTPAILKDYASIYKREGDISPTLPTDIDNPILNVFGVERGFTRSPDPLLPPDIMKQNIPPMGSPAYSDTAVKSGVDDILLNLAEDYVIEEGDTLSEIAEDRGTTVEVLQKLNNISDAKKDLIFTGDKLKVPPKSTNTIRVSTRGTSAEDELRSPTTTIKPKIRPPNIEVKTIQSVLTKLGYDPNGVDGKIGGGTQRAVRKFQKQHGLPVTGELTDDTKSAILSDSAKSYFDPPKKDAEVIDFSESDFYIFKEAVAGKESGPHGYSTYAFDIPSANIKKGDPLKGGANKHYLGKYQMGKDALSDVGIDYDATSIKKYLNSPAQQEKAFKEYTENNHEKLTKESQAYREMTPKEKLAVLGYAHNQGATAAIEFLFTGVSGKDAFGTKGKEYIDLVTDAFSRNQPIPRPQLRPLGRP